MNRYHRLFDELARLSFDGWLDVLPGQVEQSLHPDRNKLIPSWEAMIDALPDVIPSSIDLSASTVRIGMREDLSAAQQLRFEQQLKDLHPWRKGPFDLFGTKIDTEWRSDLKWDRLKDRIQPLHDRLVLDIGCGNGYHCWRMRGAGARLVIGIDPVVLYVAQFQAVYKYMAEEPVFVLPLRIEELPGNLTGFDTVFSMGVLYHRRSPLDHIMQLRALLRAGGELVLETLVVDGAKGYSLLPEGRYAKMRNVWFIPSSLTLVHWVKRCGFKHVELVDVTPTTAQEQRSTSWMHFESLPDFLDPGDATKTIEGYPAPCRAIIIARN